MNEKKRPVLAINGGERSIPEGFIKNWPPIDPVDEEYVLASLRGENHTFGPNCTAFEKEFAAWNGNQYAITTNSGTAALHMAVYSCDCGSGDEVIVPAYSWSSSATCILHHNAIPVFVDIDYATMNLDPDKIEAAITEKTKAIIVVHLHGLMADMEKITRLARKYGLKVIEDACQGHGARFQEKKSGHWGDCATFSFNQNKCLCSGEGGMFVTDNREMWEKARTLWSFGETRSPVESRDYHAYALGWMYRNNDLTAAFGRAQLTKLDRYLAVQAENAAVLLEELKGQPGLILPFVPEGHQPNWYNFTLRIDPEAFGCPSPTFRFRDAVLKAVRAEGVPTGIWQSYILPRMTVFQSRNGYGQGCPWICPNARNVIYNPEAYPAAQKHCETHFGLTTPLRAPNGTGVARKVAAAIRKVLENAGELNLEPEPKK
ncbi:MAG TPA: DegT/DnrJ/EryC1/StrS family aminotransferase [bacterium]|uniref:L-glutamine:2-deoxy-scyllo-inosose aminotransferase n=1 Tax=candidate division TA06 bacterium ADurb.Bin417 TaxID=1852828 RepID=A0A1V5MIP3_UNCT6|nr:MAG: L-glutamine:2-deoxy-scyllo-inosose aminotransferase [candidate division TA06 bacterium ADurb.Bin417]HNQ35572.1 DegT/DnrJ/EryC1/StrS family aminotransferase [bacterium]HNS48320.1 DegT/DnrJ/EryC1/StrS family aminotransferase [bacterium]